MCLTNCAVLCVCARCWDRQLVEGRVVYAHKVILSALSERFRGMFSSGFREARESQVVVPGVRHEVFLLLLEYLYTGHIDTHDDAFAACPIAQDVESDLDFVCNSLAACPQSADGRVEIEDARRRETEQAHSLERESTVELESLLELLVAADQFMLNHLKQRCERTLQHAVHVGSVEAIAEAADRANAVQLLAVCRHFRRNNPLSSPSRAASSNGCSFDGDSDPNVEETKPRRTDRDDSADEVALQLGLASSESGQSFD